MKRTQTCVSTSSATFPWSLVGPVGFEPTQALGHLIYSQTRLSNARRVPVFWWMGQDLNLRVPVGEPDLQSGAFSLSATHPCLVSREGFEPPTLGSSDRSSTN